MPRFDFFVDVSEAAFDSDSHLIAMIKDYLDYLSERFAEISTMQK